MSVIQYVCNLMVGAFLFFVIASYMTVAAGVNALGALLFFAPTILFGFISGLSFFLPKVSASLTILLVLPFAYVGIVEFLAPLPASGSSFFLVPSAIAIAVAVLALFRSQRSAWYRRKSLGTTGPILIAAILPAAYTVFALVQFFRSLTFSYKG